MLEQVATSVIGGETTSPRQGVLIMERLTQVFSVTAQVAISRRVQCFRLALRNRQDERAEAENEDSTLNTEAWGWSIEVP